MAAQEQGLPKVFSETFRALYNRLSLGYRDVDRVFIERGYLSVQAHIDRDEAICSAGSYEKFVYQQTHMDRIDEWRNIHNELHNRLMGEYENIGKEKPRLWIDAILKHPELSCPNKKILLRRHYPTQLEELLTPWQPVLEQASAKERQRLCSLYKPDNATRILDTKQVPLRKEVCNAVMEDAFGKLGFMKRKRSRGVDFYYKPLTDKYAIHVEPDVTSLQREGYDWGSAHDQEFTGFAFDCSIYLGSSDKKSTVNWYYFRPFWVYYASQLYRFKDTTSLELCVRAKALLYELTIAPFEAAIIEHGQ